MSINVKSTNELLSLLKNECKAKELVESIVGSNQVIALSIDDIKEVLTSGSIVFSSEGNGPSTEQAINNALRPLQSQCDIKNANAFLFSYFMPKENSSSILDDMNEIDTFFDSFSSTTIIRWGMSLNCQSNNYTVKLLVIQ